MIPKIIHYCWLSDDEKPDIIKKCMKSWDILKEHGFSFMLWDKSRFDVNSTVYTMSCWRNRLYAFICDYVRLKALYEYGGIYMDCDVEVIKPFDDFILNNEYFITNGKFDGINATTMACEKNNGLFKTAKKYYEKYILPFPITRRNTMIMEKRLEFIFRNNKDIILSDNVYFNPKHEITDKTYCIHYDCAEWSQDLMKLKI